MEREIAPRLGNRVFDEGRRNAEPAFVIHPASPRRHCLDAGRDGAAQTHCFEKLQGSMVDARQVGILEGAVLPSHHARADSRLVHGDGAGAESFAGFAATAALGQVFNCGHDVPFWILPHLG